MKAQTRPERAALAKASGGAGVQDRPLQLIEIASRLFATHGYTGTSLRDIAEEANYRQSTAASAQDGYASFSFGPAKDKAAGEPRFAMADPVAGV
jgi:hypothetical protein